MKIYIIDDMFHPECDELTKIRFYRFCEPSIETLEDLDNKDTMFLKQQLQIDNKIKLT